MDHSGHFDPKYGMATYKIREFGLAVVLCGDRARLEKLLPEELVTVEAFGGEWGNRKSVIEGSLQFAASGGKLVRLEFPKTEMQVYGPTAIVSTSYLYEIELGGRLKCL